ncbi:nitrilase-related carbon-nitrogen hydrolase [Nocardia camponoti]|uniref:Nitrilase n=1 Tax=Nocardia camponoti TaxID=1616106 RepID=A0A917VB20_9NOCA|nr:nitrilase-related carbon-nitrogen hydrolase [Nocardia camponoti]GGK57332.1 nitrilase [Nocardia camponoti]
MNQTRVAAVQAEPKWLNKAAGVDHVIELIETAADAGAELIAFPETMLPGFPWWMWLNSVEWGDEFRARYQANSLTIDGRELAAISSVVKARKVCVSLGFAERSRDSVYLAQALISASGDLAVARKARPTGLEQTVFASGAASAPALVRDTGFARVGVLGGADHNRADARAGMRSAGEQVHVASWSGFTICHGDIDTSTDIVCATSVRYAIDHRVFVIAPVAVVPVRGWEVMDANQPDRRLLRGGGGVARIIGPSGQELAQPLPEGEEGIIYADLNLNLTRVVRRTAAPLITPDDRGSTADIEWA